MLNYIKAIQLENEPWPTDEKEIRMAFIDHLKKIYTSECRPSMNQVVNQSVIQALPQLSSYILNSLSAIPTDEEIRVTVMSLGPHKVPGLDGFNANMVQQNWKVFGPALIKEVLLFFHTEP